MRSAAGTCSRTTNSWPAWKRFLGWEFQQLGGGIVWKFYPGEARPRQQTRGQRILELPVLSNIVGRFIRITNYGETETLGAIQGKIEAEKAGQRIEEKGRVHEAFTRFHALPTAARTGAQIRALAGEIAVSLYRDDPVALRERFPRIETRLRTLIVRGELTPLMEAIMSASEADGIEILRAWERRRGRPSQGEPQAVGR